jgi:polyhydroxyalkanoate synthesis regulator phasin
MAQDFEQFVKDVFGNISQFSSEQMNRLNGKINEIARDAIKDDLTRLTSEIAELRERVAVLEAERIAAAAEQV